MTEQLQNKGVAVLNELVFTEGPKSVVLLSMANSSASQVARAMHQMGVHMGKLSQARKTVEDKELAALLEGDEAEPTKLQEFIQQRSEAHPIWGYNRPGSLRYLHRYEKYFPDVHYVVLFRDLSAVSIARQSHAEDDFLTGLRKTHRQFKRLVDFLDQTKRPSLLVSHEKLWFHPEHFLDQLIHFLGLNPDETSRTQALQQFAQAPEPVCHEVSISGERGFFDPLCVQEVKGWAVQRGQFEPIEVEVLIDGKPVATAMANQYRKGLQKRGVGKGNHAFTLDLSPWLTGERHEIAIRTKKNQTTLKNSPRIWERKKTAWKG